MKYNFIIHTPSFNENTGGIIALHYLCHLINEIGYSAYLERAILPPIVNGRGSIVIFIRKLIYIFSNFFGRFIFPMKRYRYFNTPIYSGEINDSCIVIYSEMIDGNPLKAKNVVRWFLNKPGLLSGEINYGKDELYFFYQEIFNDENLNKDKDALLRVMYTFDDIYKQKNFGDRRGKCHILRKGKNRKIQHDFSQSTLIDGKSHEEIAEIFNSVEYCISYDLYTFYSYYAVLCGCKSIVIPEHGVDAESWQPDDNLRLGIAYGFEGMDAIDFESEKEKLENYFNEEKKNTLVLVDKFVTKCNNHFSKN